MGKAGLRCGATDGPIDFDLEAPPAMVPVDVYGRDGARIAAAYLPVSWERTRFRDPWVYARGDHVYGFRDDEDGERVVVRYRLEVEGR